MPKPRGFEFACGACGGPRRQYVAGGQTLVSNGCGCGTPETRKARCTKCGAVGAHVYGCGSLPPR